MQRVGKYEVSADTIGVTVYHEGCPVGRIDGVTTRELSEDTIEELLFGDTGEDCPYDEFL